MIQLTQMPHHVWNPDFHCHVHQSPTFDPNLSYLNPVHPSTFCFPYIYFNIIPLCVGLQMLSSLDVLTKIKYIDRRL